MINSPLRVVLLGAGKMARHHAYAIQQLSPVAEIVGVTDPSSDALSAMSNVVQGVPLERDASELFAGVTADVAHVCTPPADHAASALAALEAGLHVYVEKPFAATEADAAEMLAAAADRNLRVCAGHQLLFEGPTRSAQALVPKLGRAVHLESFFSFRQVRSGAEGRPALPPEAQLLDILPHPVYLLLAFLEQSAPEGSTDLEQILVGRAGTIHAFVRRGDVTGSLVVTLGGRPVESYLKIVGTNGSIHADYVRGTVQRAIGPGSSGIDKALRPYRTASQLLRGTTAALGRRVLSRQKSYPGLVEIFEAFYGSIQENIPSPTPPKSVLDTVSVCQRIAEEIESAGREASSTRVRQDSLAPRILVTGGTGFLGRHVLQRLLEDGIPARSVSRRPPAPWAPLPDVDYRTADLSEGVEADLLNGIEAVVHCAAETSGGWEAHERNSTGATEQLLLAAADAGVRNVVFISSLAVLSGPDPLSESSPLETGKEAGPYVWGKAESERLARELGDELDLPITVLRPGALVNRDEFDPPGKLGRRIGNLFIAVGSRRDVLGVADIADASRVAVWAALNPDAAPELLNIVDPELPTKGQLVQHLKRANPGLRVVWLPRVLLRPLSAIGVLLQKAFRPGRPAINVAKVFAKRAYDTQTVRHVWEEAVGAGSGSQSREDARTLAGSR